MNLYLFCKLYYKSIKHTCRKFRIKFVASCYLVVFHLLNMFLLPHYPIIILIFVFNRLETIEQRIGEIGIWMLSLFVFVPAFIAFGWNFLKIINEESVFYQYYKASKQNAVNYKELAYSYSMASKILRKYKKDDKPSESDMLFLQNFAENYCGVKLHQLER